MKRVLFACVGNSCRSQMAEGFARALGAGVLDVRSGGSRPAEGVNLLAVAVMWERGINISGHTPKHIDAEFACAADLIVTMGCGEDACPAFVGRPVVDWAIEDPAGRKITNFRRARDEIERRVRALVDEARAAPFLPLTAATPEPY